VAAFPPVMQPSIAACKLFETPATADTITLILSDLARPIIISTESRILFALPIEVPPNLRVSISFLYKKSRRIFEYSIDFLSHFAMK
jgi:hypothetical protein